MDQQVGLKRQRVHEHLQLRWGAKHGHGFGHGHGHEKVRLGQVRLWADQTPASET